jgi:hypothetical protein
MIRLVLLLLDAVRAVIRRRSDLVLLAETFIRDFLTRAQNMGRRSLAQRGQGSQD